MSIITLIIVLVVFGFILWAIQAFIPMDQKVKLLLQVTVVIVLLLWVLQSLGMLDTNIRLK